MKTVAFKMKLNPGKNQVYKERHNGLWPELLALLKANGIINYSIFYDEETNFLFAVQQIDTVSSLTDLKQQLIMQKWWTYMADIMEVNADNSPLVVNLEPVFNLNDLQY
jgi:L-rhamnose mutarotase